MWTTVFAVLHLICLPMGIGALLMRAWATADTQSNRDLKRLFLWDNVYGVIALVWIGTGLYRAFGGTDKGSAYYLGNHVFWLKILLITALLVVELRPMILFVRWRIHSRRGAITVDDSLRQQLLRRHAIEFVLLIGIVVCASTMARGIGGVSAETIAHGGAIYRSECAHCHQLDGRGQSGRAAPDFVGNPVWLAKTNRVLLKSIAHGVPGTTMLGFEGQLSDADQREVLEYIRATFGRTQ